LRDREAMKSGAFCCAFFSRILRQARTASSR
jgi:hypothetical protein